MIAPWFQHARAGFAKACIEKQLYYTLCLVGASSVRLVNGLPALAAMSQVGGNIQIMFSPQVEQLVEAHPEAFNFLMFHEVRHITQLSSMVNAIELPDLSPLVQRGHAMIAQCTDPQKQASWEKWLEQLADRKNPITYKLLQTACNIGMDAAVNRDAIKIWGDTARQRIDEFMFAQLPPEKQKQLLESGQHRGCVTVDSLSKLCGTRLETDAEWLYYTNEYIRSISNSITDPNDEPQPAGIELDSHDAYNTADEGEQAEIQQACKEASERAHVEAKSMAERAGTKLGDAEFISGDIPIDRRIKTLLDKMRFKIKQILQPSPEEQYTFNQDNRLWPNRGLPAAEAIMKPRPSVALVVDVSGSCWRPDWLNQMMAAARHLQKKKQLAGVWSFDMVLTHLTFDNHKPTKMSGGGGTVWRPEFTDEILQTLKSRKVDIVLLSDMYIDGLEDLAADNRVKLHKIKIDGILS